MTYYHILTYLLKYTSNLVDWENVGLRKNADPIASSSEGDIEVSASGYLYPQPIRDLAWV